MLHTVPSGTLDPSHLEFRQKLVRHWYKVAMLIWRNIGDGKVGMVLLDRYWSGDDPWVSADYVTAALANLYSEDTIRRRLKVMAQRRAVLERKEGRLTLYAFRPSIADEITEAMEEFALAASCGKISSPIRNLRENFVVIEALPTHTGAHDKQLNEP